MSDKCRWTLIQYIDGSLMSVGVYNIECNSSEVSEIFREWKYCPYCGREIEKVEG